MDDGINPPTGEPNTQARADRLARHAEQYKRRDAERKAFFNRTTIEILDDPEVRASPLHVFIGERDFDRVAIFLNGYDAALLDYSREKSILNGFREWLQMYFDDPAHTPWPYFIMNRYGNGSEAVQEFFELWDAFRKERAEKGLETILSAHRDFEMRHYGGLVSRRYLDE